MNIKKVQFNNIFENTEDLINQIHRIVSDTTDSNVYNKLQDKFELLANEILNSYKKDLHFALEKKQMTSVHLRRTMLSLKYDDNVATLDYNHRLILLLACRRILTDKILTLNFDTRTESDITNSLANITDITLLHISKKHQIEITNTIKHNKKIINDLKIVKNDVQKQLDLTYQLIKNSPVGLVGCDSELLIKIWNPVAENLTGYQISELIGKSILNIFTVPSQSIINNQIIHDSYRKKRMRLNIQTKDGGIFNAYVFMNRLKTEIKQKVQYIFNIVDLSKEEQLKSQLEKIEQLGAIARLSDAIMHDVRNPINSLSLNIDVLTQRLKGRSSSKREISYIIEKINRQISNLTQSLERYVGYSRITELKLEPMDIGQPLSELIRDTRHQVAGRQIKIHYHRPKTQLIIHGDWYQLIRVFRNLIDNAIDAIDTSGHIDISVRRRNKNITISFIDNGSGINSENLSNVFKPYFTTKDKGSGLGLFIVREIVRAHHGRIYCKSSDEQGTRFTVSIPALGETT